MGSWDRPAHAQLEARHLDWLRTVPTTQVFRDQVFLCHATPADDDVYWLETVMPDGSVRMSSLEAIEKEARRNLAVADSLRPYPSSRARSGFATDAWWSIPAASASPGFSDTFRFRM